MIRFAKDPRRVLIHGQIRTWLSTQALVPGEPVEPPDYPHPKLSYEIGWAVLIPCADAFAAPVLFVLAFDTAKMVPPYGIPLLTALTGFLATDGIRRTLAILRWSAFLRKTSHAPPIACNE